MQDDRTLVRQYKSGNPNAIAELMDQYYRLSLYCAGNILGSLGRQEAEDCVNEAFIGVWQNAKQYDETQCSLKTWVLLFVRRRAIDYARKQTHRENLSLDDEWAISLSTMDEWSIFEQREQINAILRQLDKKELEIFYRRFFYGQTVDQVAKEMGVSFDSVKSIIYRVRGRIRDLCEKEGWI